MDDEQTFQIKRELAQLRGRIEALEVSRLRSAALLAVVTIVVGLFVPMWDEEDNDPDDVSRDVFRPLTAGFKFLADDDTNGEERLIGYGLIGLVAVLLWFCAVLLSAVVAREGRGSLSWARNVLAALAVIGTLIAGLLTLIAMGSDGNDVVGGPGALVVLAGVIGGVVVFNHKPWQELWLDKDARR